MGRQQAETKPQKVLIGLAKKQLTARVGMLRYPALSTGTKPKALAEGNGTLFDK